MAEEDTTLQEGATPVRGSDVTRLVRMSLRPPTRFAAGADFTLWLTSLIRNVHYSRQTLPHPSG